MFYQLKVERYWGAVGLVAAVVLAGCSGPGLPVDELGAHVDPIMIPPTCTPYCSIYQACGTSDGCIGTCSQPGVTCAYPRASAGGLTDVDYDGVPDALELALAQKFMPKLWMSNTTDRDELYAFSGGGMPYRVNQVVGFTEVGQYLLIQYALPYDYQRAKCGLGSHTGDSEYVEVLVGRAPYYGTAYGGTSWENARTDVNAWAVFAGKANHHSSQTVVVIQDSKTTMPDKNRVPDLFIAAITHASFWAWDKCNNDAIFWPCYDVCQPLCNAKPKALLSMRNLDTQGTWGSMTKDPNTLVWDTYPMNSSANPNFGAEPGYYGKFHEQANYLNALSSCLGGGCDGPWFNQVVGFPDCQ